jgi:hypothetical protein
MNVRFEGNNGHDAIAPLCPLMTLSGHSRRAVEAVFCGMPGQLRPHVPGVYVVLLERARRTEAVVGHCGDSVGIRRRVTDVHCGTCPSAVSDNS